MKNIALLYITVLMIGLLSGCMFTASNMSHGGFYIPGIDFLYCTSDKTCIHERAHQIDAENGFISSKMDYHIAVYVFAMTNPTDYWSSAILNYQNSYSEMYAQMYESVMGDIYLLPEELQRFYLVTK